MRPSRVLAALALVATAAVAWAQAASQPHKSHFGFTVQLSDEWLVVSPGDAAEASAEDTLASLGLDAQGDQANFKAILERVKSGKVEFYFDRRTVAADFQNNISAQLMPGSNPVTEDGVATLCQDIPSQMPAVFGAPVEVQACGIRQANGVDYVSYEFSVPTLSIHAVQAEIPFTGDSTLVVVGGSHEAGEPLDRLKAVQNAIVEGATRLVGERSGEH
jgi:hypothetical protein